MGQYIINTHIRVHDVLDPNVCEYCIRIIHLSECSRYRLYRAYMRFLDRGEMGIPGTVHLG